MITASTENFLRLVLYAINSNKGHCIPDCNSQVNDMMIIAIENDFNQFKRMLNCRDSIPLKAKNCIICGKVQGKTNIVYLFTCQVCWLSFGDCSRCHHSGKILTAGTTQFHLKNRRMYPMTSTQHVCHASSLFASPATPRP